MTHFEIDVNGQTLPADRSWQFGMGNDHAHQILRTDMCEHMKLAHDELGLKYVRFHGIFNDDMYTYSTFRDFAPMPGDKHRVREMNFRQTGVAYDNVLKCGMKPFVELSMMPKHLARGKSQGLHYPNNIYPPKDYARWGEFITAFIRFLLNRYGEDEVAGWYFEVWNEPDLKVFFKGSQSEYFKMYEVASKAIKKVCPRLRVGGPSTSACRWIGDFLAFCKASGSPCDFVSTHHYPGDGFGNMIAVSDYPKIFSLMRGAMKKGSRLNEAMSAMFFHPEKAAKVPKGALIKMDDDLVSRAGGKEVFISEWNSMAIFSAPIHDEKYSACFALKSVLDLKGKIKGYMFWCISDIFEELLQVNRPFHGGYGVINSDGIPKPNFWAFKLLSKLGDERIKLPADPAADVEIAAFKKGGEIQVLVYAQTNDPREDKTFNVTFTVNAEASGVSVESIDDDSCNPKRVWREMGAPDNPTPAQVEEIKARSALKSSPAAFECGGGKTTIKTTLKSNDIRMFTLKIKEI